MLVSITAQFYENYSFIDGEVDGENPYWKPKGGQVFQVHVPVDTLMYGEEAVIASIKRALKSYSNDYARYEYIDHEVTTEAIVINQKRFDLTVQDELEKLHC